ncbi:13568_t:CDS:2 [Entrophospora sp. SA101]|nr:13568_t:CDS:2 [Entrophospora sp. SA101]
MNPEQNANILDSDDGYYIASNTRRWGGLYDNELSEIAKKRNKLLKIMLADTAHCKL